MGPLVILIQQVDLVCGCSANMADDEFKVIGATANLIYSICGPICRLLSARTVSARLDATEKNIDLAYAEIQHGAVLPYVPPERLQAMITLLEGLQADLDDLRENERLPQSLKPKNLKCARDVHHRSHALHSMAVATSSEVRWANTPQCQNDAIRKAATEKRVEEDKRRTPKEPTSNPKFAKRQTFNSKKAVRQDAELYAARIELGKACSEIPGLDAKKVLDVIIMILSNKLKDRPCDITNFKKVISKCVNKNQSKGCSEKSKSSAKVSDEAIARLTKGLADLAALSKPSESR